ncbi:hypothetical protein K8R14_00810 [bacterium]|nr:hypothetical protein [bacterium]
MAGYKGKSETISSVSDILGFILEQSELPPEKRRPVRPPQTADSQASSEYAQTLVDALAMPGTFVGEKYLETVEGLVSPTIAIGTQTGRIPNVKITASALPEFFENPDEFVDKLFQKNKDISKMQKIRWAGEQMRVLAGSTYAKKMGLFDDYGDLKSTLERGLGQVAMDSGNERDKQWITKASIDIKEHGMVNSVSVKDLERRKKVAHSIKGKERIQGQIEALSFKHGSEEEAKKDQDIGTFRSLLGLEFDERRIKILDGRDLKDLDSKELDSFKKVQSASNTLSLWSGYEKLDHRGMKDKWSNIREQRKEISDIKQGFGDRLKAIKNGTTITLDDGNTIDYGKLSSSDRQKEKAYISKNLKQLSTTERSLTSVYLWSKIGQAEGVYHGLKQTFGPGGVEAFLNGDFFDPNKGFFGCPSAKGKFRGVEFVTSKSTKYKKEKGGKYKATLTDTYNDTMVRLYYLNPTTWMKTAFNGSGFAWIAENREVSLAKMWGVKESRIFKDLQKPEFWAFYKRYKDLDPTKQTLMLDRDPKYKALLGYISKGLGEKAFAKKFKQAEKIFKSLERFSGLSRFFSTPTRIRDYIVEGTIGKVQKGFRNNAYRVLSKMKIFTNSEAAKSLLRTWKATGGSSLSAAIAQGILTALGAASSVVAGPLGVALTLAVSVILEKVAKVSIKVFIYAFIGIFGAIILLGASIEFGSRAQVDSYSREIPGTIYENPNFGGYGGFYSGWFSGGGGNFVPPPINIPAPTNSSCPLGDVKYRCSQGFTRTVCSHKNITHKYPVDLTGFSFFYAPQYCDTSTCTASLSSMAAWRCSDGSFTGRNIEFSDGQGNVFNLMHTKLISPGNGRNYKAGEPVAYIYQYAAEMVADDPLGITKPNKNGVFYCWTGAHIHLTITHNGQYIDPIAFLVEMGCTNGAQSESECPPCK